ncbi:MAG: 4Fe-4S dicluster-binding protein [Nanoarchaeota archaeon]
MNEKPKWQDLEEGGKILDAGNSSSYKTGAWRTFRPVFIQEKCINCMICWIYCPDISIPVKDEKRLETNFDSCKGCGICAKVCPVKCIEMKDENDFK